MPTIWLEGVTSGGNPASARTLRHFEQHLFHTVAGALLLQLALHVGEHAAGNLAVENLGFHARDVGEELFVARPYAGEVLLQLDQPGFVEPGVEAGAVEHLHQALGGVVARSQAERADRRVDAIRAGFDGLHEADQGDAGGGVHVNVNAHVPFRKLL